MESSGVETLNYRIRTNLNKIINFTASNITAIFYSRCYILGGFKNKNYYERKKFNNRKVTQKKLL